MARPKVHDAALRERLLERAGALLTDGGTDALSMRTLAQDCGTSTTAVYSLFGGKPALLEVLRGGAISRLVERLAAVEPGPDPVEHVARLALAYRAAALDDPNLHDVMVAAPPTAPDISAALAPLADGVRRAVEARALRTDADPSTVALAVQGLVHGLVTLELRGLTTAGTATAALRAAIDGWRRA